MSLKLVPISYLGAVAVVALSAAPQQAPPATEIYLMAMPGAQKPDLVRWADISNNAGDNWLHVVLAIVLLAAGFGMTDREMSAAT